MTMRETILLFIRNKLVEITIYSVICFLFIFGVCLFLSYVYGAVALLIIYTNPSQILHDYQFYFATYTELVSIGLVLWFGRIWIRNNWNDAKNGYKRSF